jgi:rubrerythrin
VNVTLNALEIFEIAEKIEQNGARFYKQAAEIFDDPDICSFFLKLTDWELKHKEIFSGMKKQYAESNPDIKISGPEQTLPEAKVMAGLAVFGIRPNPSDELSGKEGISDVLKRAIEKEKDSIVFYSGLRDFSPAASAKEKIDEIIREELRHIEILSKVWQKTS